MRTHAIDRRADAGWRHYARTPCAKAAPAAWSSLDGQSPRPGHSLDLEQWATHTGRSPGSRVDAWRTPSRTMPSGCSGLARNPCVTLTAYSCRDSPGF